MPDRRLSRAVVQLAARAASDGQTEVSILIPTRAYRRSWAVLLHGKNANRLIRVLGQIPHVNATVVPFNVADLAASQRALADADALLRPPKHEKSAERNVRYLDVPGATPIAQIAHRQSVRVAGRIRSVRVQSGSDAPSLECTLTDASGGELTVVFMGRKEVPGIRTGTQIVLTGMVGERRGRLAVLNPVYELLAVPETESGGAAG